MKINISTPPYFEIKVLDEHRYVTEMVTLYRNKYDEDGKKCLVAYPSWHRPMSLDSEHPLIDEHKGIMYDKVVEGLFNNWLIEIMSAHKRPIREDNIE